MLIFFHSELPRIGSTDLADYLNGLVIVDINNKNAPVFAGSYDIECAYGVSVSGDYAYLADSNGLVIVDISNKNAPVFVGSYDTKGSSHDVSVSGDYAYVADYRNGLVILRVENMDDWKNEWIGEESEGGTVVTITELQDAIHHWLEDIRVREHMMSTADLQEIIAIWLSG